MDVVLLGQKGDSARLLKETHQHCTSIRDPGVGLTRNCLSSGKISSMSYVITLEGGRDQMQGDAVLTNLDHFLATVSATR